MASSALDDLIVSNIEKPSRASLNNLYKAISEVQGNAETLAKQLNVLWEGWDGKVQTPEMAEFVAAIAATGIPTDPHFRKLLVTSVKTLLPNDQGTNPILRALGVRDEKTPVEEVATRVNRLRDLKSNAVFFQPSAARWCVVTSIDPMNASIVAKNFTGTGNGGAVSIPLDKAIREIIILAANTEVNKLVNPISGITSAKFREMVKRFCRVEVSEIQMRTMALTGCAKKLSEQAFNTWWKTEAVAPKPASERRPCDGRSILEINNLLDAEEQKNITTCFESDEAALFAAFFERLKPETAKREAKALAELVAKIAKRLNNDQEKLQLVFTPLKGKASFWPVATNKVPLETLSVWGELSATHLAGVVAATCAIFDNDYLAVAMTKLPLKALNALGAAFSEDLYDVIYDYVSEQHAVSSDLLLWVWKNRKTKHLEDTDLFTLINIENVVRVLGNQEVPKVWGPALRELKTQFMDKEDFQKALITAAAGNAMMFTSALQAAIFLTSGERQSLLVKLSRVSPALQSYLENGAASKILSAGIGKVSTPKAPTDNDPHYTSVKSHNKLIAELDNIINVLIPENREALKFARSLGDFRENSEFDAAKERRNHLGKRRHELEMELAMIQPILMANVTVENTAVIGSQVVLEMADKSRETYYLLGTADGDADKNYISYLAGLGKAIFNHSKGETITIPGNKKATIVEVNTLPAELIAELDA